MNANPVDLEAFTPVLKTVYLPIRKKAFPIATVLGAQLTKSGPERVTYTGHDLVFDVKLDRRGGFTSSRAGFFPVSKISREKPGRLGITRSYLQVSVDGLAVKAANSTKGSFIPLAKKVAEDALDQWQLEQNRILHGNGRGIRAIVTTDGGATSIGVQHPYGITGAGPGNLHLVIGDDVAFYTAAGVFRSKHNITNITLSGDEATLTISPGDAAIAVTDLVVTSVPTARDATDSSLDAEAYGLDAWVDPTSAFLTFEGINDARWRANSFTATSVDEMSLMTALNTIKSRSGVDWMSNPKSMLLLTTTGIWQQYGESLLGLRRFSAPVMELKGGFTGVGVGGAVLVTDDWAPRGRLYMIHTSDAIMVDLFNFGLLGYEDSPEWQGSTIQDVYTATYGVYWNAGVVLRNSHGVITGINDTQNFSPVY